MRLKAFSLLTLLLFVLLAPWHASTNAQPSVAVAKTARAPIPNNTKDALAQPTVKLRIELTGGDDDKPIPDASVYLRFQLDPKSKKSKPVEVNLKTNQEGVALSPDIPQGVILIQVVAPGWKTFGEKHDIEQAEMTMPIHLSRPTTNYY
jgi:hypothetical protein